MHGEREFNFVFFTDGNIMGFQKLTCSLIICLLHFQKGKQGFQESGLGTVNPLVVMSLIRHI